jgi:hypothetical protein
MWFISNLKDCVCSTCSCYDRVFSWIFAWLAGAVAGHLTYDTNRGIFYPHSIWLASALLGLCKRSARALRLSIRTYPCTPARDLFTLIG